MSGENERSELSLGSFIRAQREMANLSLRQLSSLTEISNAYLSQIERDLHQPSIKVLKSVGDALGITRETLLAQAGLLRDDEPGADGDPSGTRVGTDDADRAEGGGGATSAVTVESAIAADQHLDDTQKQALLAVYRSLRSQGETG